MVGAGGGNKMTLYDNVKAILRWMFVCGMARLHDGGWITRQSCWRGDPCPS